MRFSRDDKGILANWWFTVDKVLIAAVLILMGIGVLVSLAASPAIAVKCGYAVYHFVERHVIFVGLGGLIMLAVSLLSPLGVRRLSVLLAASGLVLMGLVLVMGAQVNGATRWLALAGHSFQPSEFYKPAFVVMAAWLFSPEQGPGMRSMAEAPIARSARQGMPALIAAVLLYLVTAALLLAQPDVGQTLLLSLVWGALFLLSGQSLKWVAGLAATGLAGIGAAYFGFAHVRARIDRFLDPASGDTYQSERALQSFAEGGFWGRGPGEGTIKTILPDAHTDYVFAVIAEEYGILACLVLLALFAFITLRAIGRVWDEPDPFTRNAATGLALLFALQAAINMAVNVGLLPAKGMTLPFISTGGSSILALGLTMGMIVALTRRRAGRLSLKKPRFVSKADAGQAPGAEFGETHKRMGSSV